MDPKALSLSLSNIGALIIRIGFWGFLIVIIIIVEYTPKPYSDYEGPYLKPV